MKERKPRYSNSNPSLALAAEESNKKKINTQILEEAKNVFRSTRKENLYCKCWWLWVWVMKSITMREQRNGERRERERERNTERVWETTIQSMQIRGENDGWEGRVGGLVMGPLNTNNIQLFQHKYIIINCFFVITLNYQSDTLTIQSILISNKPILLVPSLHNTYQNCWKYS